MLRCHFSRPDPRPPTELVPLAVAALLCMFGVGVQAQVLPRVRPTPSPVTPREAAGADAPPPTVALMADDIVSHLGGVTQARGKVGLSRFDMNMVADLLVYDQLSNTAHADGHVRIDRGTDWFSAMRVDLELTRQAGTLVDTEYELGAFKSGGHAQRIELVDSKHFSAYAADYSSCPRDIPSRPPDWIISGDRIDVDAAGNQGRATNAVLRFLGVPILAAPSLTFPVTADRKSGWLAPTPGFSTRGGVELSESYYLNLETNLDATITPVVYSKRGAAITAEFRYLGASDLGQVTGFSLPDDKSVGHSRGSLGWAHEGTRGDWLTYSARVQRVSDDQYWKDFSNQIPSVTPRLLPTDLSTTRRLVPFGNVGEIDAYARVERFQTLQDFGDDPRHPNFSAVILPPYQRSPQVGVHGHLMLANDLRFEFETEANRFDLSNRLPKCPGVITSDMPTCDNRSGGMRAHLIGAVSREFFSDWGHIAPRLSINGATYRTDTPMADGRFDAARWIPTFSTDSSASFERQTMLFGRELLQTLEPRLFYVLTPTRNQNNLPQYDTAAKDFNEVSIYSDNQFTGIDRITDANQLTAGTTTRINDTANGSEFLRLGIAQRFLFKDQSLTTDGTPDARKISNLLVFGSSSAMEHWSFDGTVELDPSSNWTQRAVIGTRYHPGPYKSLSLTYRFARDSSKQYEVGGQWPIYHRAQATDGANGCGGTLYAVGRIDYSVTDRRATYAVGGIEYDAGCWIGRFVVERQSTGLNVSNPHYMLQLELKGLSSLGIGDALHSLRNSVPGYELLRKDPGLSDSSNNPH